MTLPIEYTFSCTFGCWLKNESPDLRNLSLPQFKFYLKSQQLFENCLRIGIAFLEC
jgi:hypothetical protein